MPASSHDSAENVPEQALLRAMQDAQAGRESELSFLTRLFETLPYPVSYVDAHLVCRQCNPAAAATVGRTPDQITGESVASVVGSESPVLDLLRGVLATGRPFCGTVEFTAPGSKSPAFYRASYLPDIDAEGDVIGVLTNVVDVTDLVRGERALRASEDRLRRIARAGRIGFFEYNVATDEAYWNPEHYGLFGFEDGSQVGWQRWLEGVHPDDRERVEANAARLLERAVAEGRVQGHADQYRFVRPDGTMTWVEADMSADMVDGQAIVRGVVRDFTERKRLEDELARQQEELRLLVRHATTGIYEIDFRGPRFLSVNDFMCTYSGYSREELLAMDPMALLDEESRARFHARVSATLAGEAIDPQVEYRFLTRQGEVRHAVLNITPTFEDGRPVGAFVVGQDVSERKRMEGALRESEERNAFLLLLTDALRPLDDPIAVLETASRLLGEHLEADRVGYFEVDGDDCIVERDWAPSVPHLSGRFPVAAFGDLMNTYQSGRMVVMDDVAEEVLDPREREMFSGMQVAAQISTPLVKDGRFVGGMTVHSAAPRAWTAQEKRLLQETAERTWAVLERARAEAALREHEAERVARQERGRLARDLHDSVTQSLFAAMLKAEALTLTAGDQAPGMADALEELRRLNRGALAQMRTMLLELRGDPVQEVPLHHLLRNLVEAAESRTSVSVELTLDEGSALPPDVHEAVYRIAQEALNNVTRHSRARNAWVELYSRPSFARLLIGDDGCGFDPGSVEPGHFGLKSVEERAGDSGGRLTVRSVPGEGAVVTVEWRSEGSGSLGPDQERGRR
jgi:PAS domain S-box-containing protein